MYSTQDSRKEKIDKISTETVYHDFYIQLAASVPRYMVPGYPVLN